MESSTSKGATTKDYGGVNPKSLWGEVLAILSETMSVQAFETWLRPTHQLGSSNGVLRVQVPTPVFKSWIEKSYGAKILAALDRLGSRAKLQLVVPDAAPVQPASGSRDQGAFDALVASRRFSKQKVAQLAEEYRAHDYTTFRTSSGLIDKKHRRKIGAAIWEFFWCIDRQTGPEGLVLGGKPVTLAEMARPYGVSRRLVGRSLEKLERHGYLEITRTRTGLVIRVVNQKKFGPRKKGGI